MRIFKPQLPPEKPSNRYKMYFSDRLRGWIVIVKGQRIGIYNTKQGAVNAAERYLKNRDNARARRQKERQHGK
jgi:hypothetical protein